MKAIESVTVGELTLTVAPFWSAGHGYWTNTYRWRVTIPTKYGRSEISSGRYHSVKSNEIARLECIARGRAALSEALQRFPQPRAVWPGTEFRAGDRVRMITAPYWTATVCEPDGYGGVVLEWDADQDGGPYEDEIDPAEIVKIPS